MFEEVLVPIDGSDCSDVAVGYAEDLAARYDARVHVLNVIDPRGLENAPLLEQLQTERSRLTEQRAEDLSESGLRAEHAVSTGIPSQSILHYSERHDIDLLVMGTHGRTGARRFFLGSVTETVIRRSDVPVLGVTPRADNDVTYPYEDILVPTDGSEGAMAAVEPAIDIAQSYGARIHALSVVDTLAMGVDVRSTSVLELLEESARTAVERIEDRVPGSGVPAVETAIEHGSPYRKIREYAVEHGIDLVVMGTHGRSGIERYLLGSVTEKTVRTASTPVMTVRRRE